MKLSISFALTVWALAVVAHAGVASQTAEQFLRSIYNAYTGDPEKAPTIRLEDQANIRKYFEPGLAAMIIADETKAQQEEDVPALDFDPFVNGQDFTLTGPVTIKISPGTGAVTLATVRFTNSGRVNTLKYSLVKVGGQWRIYDIDWGGDGGTLRALYQQH